MRASERGGDGRRRHGGARRRRVVCSGESDDRCGWNRPPLLRGKVSTARQSEFSQGLFCKALSGMRGDGFLSLSSDPAIRTTTFESKGSRRSLYPPKAKRKLHRCPQISPPPAPCSGDDPAMAAAVTFRRLMLASAVLRLALMVFGEWQDAHLAVRYTDVDYLVFSDAAASVAAGGSPFARSTYRYSPLLAWLLLPNSLLHAAWGKLIFSAADLLVGQFIDTILELRGIPEKIRLCSVVAWLFNPFTFTIGTRGNCEPIVCAVILWILICLMKGRVLQAAFWYGLIVHFRIYPIIYAIPFVVVLGKSYTGPSGRPTLTLRSSEQQLRTDKANQEEEPTSFIAILCGFPSSFMTRNAILFGLLSGSMFFAWTGVFFYLYGWDFLNEALLYHLTRTDPRHNFSIYFYHIYLHHQQGFSSIQRLASFLPQVIVQLSLILRFSKDLPFCMFLQTVAFVAFNKVMTAQYFVWFFCLLPLILPWTGMKLKWKGLACILLWMGSQLHWLRWAYLLEFKGQNVFIQLWIAGLVFLAANTFVMIMVMKHHMYTPLFSSLVKSGRKIASKKD